MRQELIDTIKQAVKLSKTDIPLARLLAFIEVESGGRGFAEYINKDGTKTTKLIIQFEAGTFSKATGIARSKDNNWAWDENVVDVQSKEWEAFNEAFTKVDKVKAMESTSWGLPQIMGFNYKQAGYNSVGEMLDDYKRGELQQVVSLIKFIQNSSKLYKAVLAGDYEAIASTYNGSGHRALALKNGWKPYPDKLKEAEEKYKSVK
ncbi:DUF3380 domain-containing protein [Candidatus Dependentiae bacterium]|nr:MAG: DUF3380 domain-containing protein [Candidatus Dependentiae bacterium]